MFCIIAVSSALGNSSDVDTITNDPYSIEYIKIDPNTNWDTNIPPRIAVVLKDEYKLYEIFDKKLHIIII